MMTKDKTRKIITRARMAATGETYAEAARILAEQHDPATGAFGGPLCHPRVAVALLFSDSDDQILLVRGPAATGWDLPGRYLRPHEFPATVSVEMVPELLGISPHIGQMLVVDWAPHPEDGFPEADKVTFVFDGGQLTTEQIAYIAPDVQEITEYAFHDPSQLAQLLSPNLTRRITAAIAARTTPEHRYLEMGHSGR